MGATAPPDDLVRLPPRDAAASKRDYGRVAVAGGVTTAPEPAAAIRAFLAALTSDPRRAVSP